MSRYYSFQERLQWADGFLDEGIEKILQSRIPGCVAVKKAVVEDDRSGTDYWVLRDGLPPLSVDVKTRSVDHALTGEDDLALETWSVTGTKIGWTRNAKKRTDYILWFWTDSRRFVLVSFPALCRTFRQFWEQWRSTYKVAVQDSGGWRSECVFVPRTVVMDKLIAWSCSEIPKKAANSDSEERVL